MNPVSDAPGSDAIQGGPEQATLDAAAAMLEPLVGLLLARGQRIATAQELLKAAFVRSAARAFAAQGKPPSVSTLSVATGLRRREVQRVLNEQMLAQPAEPKVSLTSQVLLRWTTSAAYLDAQGQPRRLLRTAGQTGEPCFADLASEVSKDVHWRPLLDEMVRMGAAEEDGDYACLRGRLNAPDRSWDSLVRIGGVNVADHLSAVLVNLLSKPRPFVEQSFFADGLTRQSAQRAADVAKEVWTQALPDLATKVQTLLDLDEKAPDNGWRMRIGLFSYVAPMERPDPAVRMRARKPGAETARQQPGTGRQAGKTKTRKE